MDKPLFALKDDLDMLAEKVQQLYIGFTQLDWIVQKMKKLDEELTCQGEQMRRIEKWMYGTDEKIQSLDQIVNRLEQRIDGLEHRMDSLEHRMDSLERRMDSLEHRMDKMEILLILICKKLKIKIPT